MPAANIKNVTFALPVTMMDEIRQWDLPSAEETP